MSVEDNNSYLIGNFKYKLDGGLYNIEPDATAASYFLSLPIAITMVVFLLKISKIASYRVILTILGYF